MQYRHLTFLFLQLLGTQPSLIGTSHEKNSCVFVHHCRVSVARDGFRRRFAAASRQHAPCLYCFRRTFGGRGAFFHGMDPPGRDLHPGALRAFDPGRHHGQGSLGQFRRHQHPDHCGPVHAGRGHLRHGLRPARGDHDHQQGGAQRNPPSGLRHSSHRLHVGLSEQCRRHGHHPAHDHFHRPQGAPLAFAHLAAHSLRGQLRRLHLAGGSGAEHGGQRHPGQNGAGIRPVRFF